MSIFKTGLFAAGIIGLSLAAAAVVLQTPRAGTNKLKH
jgi:hypothetical protein